METDTSLPPLPRASGLYLAVLLVLVAVFYVILVASLGLAAYLFVRLVLWTPGLLAQQQSLGAVKLLLILYAAILVYGYAVVKSLRVKTGGDPAGIRLNRTQYPGAFALVDEVAARVQADPIHEIFLVPDTEVGVWEETALYLPPGSGKRKIVLGMGALSFLTLDELRSVLAHEYAHFSHRDTFFGRFIYRVTHSTAILLHELRRHGGWVRYLNPMYWALRLFATLYPRLSARFSRIREYYADRCAVEGYGRDLFARSLITVSLESSFFGEAGSSGALTLGAEGHGFKNVYHFVGAARREFDREAPDGAEQVLSAMLVEPSHRLDSHPSLRERLDAQGVPDALRHPYPLPQPITTPDLDILAPSDTSAASDEPSAAQALLGADTPVLQARLSEVYGAPYVMLGHLLRQAQQSAPADAGADAAVPKGRSGQEPDGSAV
jgi:Zn-dependent protease with chaperone function